MKDIGIMNKRDVNTFVKKTTYMNKADVDRLQYVGRSHIKTSPFIEPIQYLWEYNCSIYSVVKAWKLIQTKEKNVDKERKTSGKPRWMTNIESDMRRTEENTGQSPSNVENEEKPILDDERNRRKNNHCKPDNFKGNKD